MHLSILGITHYYCRITGNIGDPCSHQSFRRTRRPLPKVALSLRMESGLSYRGTASSLNSNLCWNYSSYEHTSRHSRFIAVIYKFHHIGVWSHWNHTAMPLKRSKSTPEPEEVTPLLRDGNPLRKKTPLPLTQIFILILLQLSEPMTSSSIKPYINEVCSLIPITVNHRSFVTSVLLACQ